MMIARTDRSGSPFAAFRAGPAGRILCLVFALVLSIGGAGGQDRPVPTEEDLAAYGDAVATVYQWEQQYETVLDGLIEASRQMPGLWSGTRNAETEEERVALVREMLLERRDSVIARAKSNLIDAADPYVVIEHLERMVAGEIKPEDTEIRDTVHKAYRDAIFDTMMLASVEAQEQIDSRQ